MKKKHIKFNINEYVLVSLTNDGKECYKNHYHQYDYLYKKSPYLMDALTFLKKYHKKGKYYRFQLWELMSIFGSSISMGSPNMFDLEIILEKL